MSVKNRKTISLYRLSKYDSLSDLMEKFNGIQKELRVNTNIPIDSYGDYFEIKETPNSYYLYTRKKYSNLYELGNEMINESYDINRHIKHKKDRSIAVRNKKALAV